MSWSVGATGKAPAVRAAIAKQFEQQSKCVEPEETIRQAIKAILDEALSAQSGAVKVGASGSQSMDYNTKAVSHSLSVTVEPVWGFLE